jgi:hypothetical protein
MMDRIGNCIFKHAKIKRDISAANAKKVLAGVWAEAAGEFKALVAEKPEFSKHEKIINITVGGKWGIDQDGTPRQLAGIANELHAKMPIVDTIWLSLGEKIIEISPKEDKIMIHDGDKKIAVRIL